VPLHPGACRRSAPSLCVKGFFAKPRRRKPRENNAVCPQVSLNLLAGHCDYRRLFRILSAYRKRLFGSFFLKRTALVTVQFGGLRSFPAPAVAGRVSRAIALGLMAVFVLAIAKFGMIAGVPEADLLKRSFMRDIWGN
jgi:hypothetical protein